MKKIVLRCFTMLFIVGLVFGNIPARIDFSLANLISSPQSPIQKAAAAEYHIVNLPYISKSPPIPTVFGTAVSLRGAGLMDQMMAAGNYWVRKDVIPWSLIEPTQGARDWSSLISLETEMKNIQQRGMQMVLIVDSTPGWAQAISGYFCGPIKKTAFPAFASFMYDLVSRYSQPPYNVKYWEIWNEPDIDHTLIAPDSGYGCWGDANDPYYGGGYYADMLKVIYPEIKRADPQAQVLVGGLLLDCDPRTPGLCPNADRRIPPKFLEGILRRNGAKDGGNYFDGISFHAYDYYNPVRLYFNNNWNSSWNIEGPVLIAKAEFIKDLLNQYGVTGKFLMSTESALICGDPEAPPGGPGCSSDPSSPYEQAKAYYVAQVYAASIAEDLRANIWYHVFGWRNSALLNTDLTERPAYLAFAAARNILLNAKFSREITDYPGVRIYEFTRDTHRLWVLWSMDGAWHSVNLDNMPNEVYNTLGMRIYPSNPLQIGIEPLYLEWHP